MKQPVAVIDITDVVTLAKTGVNGHTLDIVAGSEEGQPYYIIVDINGTDIGLTFIQMPEGGWELVVFDCKDDKNAIVDHIEENLFNDTETVI